MADDQRVSIPPELLERADRTDTQLRRLALTFRTQGLLEEEHPAVTIYATGSLGRGELGDRSDLDVFLVDTAHREDEQMGSSHASRCSPG